MLELVYTSLIILTIGIIIIVIYLSTVDRGLLNGEQRLMLEVTADIVCTHEGPDIVAVEGTESFLSTDRVVGDVTVVDDPVANPCAGVSQ